MRAHKALKVPLILSRTRIRVVLGARGNLGLVNKCVRVGKVRTRICMSRRIRTDSRHWHVVMGLALTRERGGLSEL